MVEVTYRGGNMDGITSNAASEATLQKILKALGKGGGGGDAQSLFNKAQEKGTDQINKAAKAQKKHTADVGKDTTATSKHAKTVEKSSKAFDNFKQSLKGFAQGVSSNIGGLGSALLEGKTNIADYTTHLAGLAQQIPLLGMVAGPIQSLVTVLDTQIDTTRQLSQVGGDLGDSLMSVFDQAAKARMSLESYSALMGDQANNLALAFGGASRGMREFSEITKGVKDMDMEFAALGYTMDEVGEYTAEYLDLQRIQGRLASKNQTQMIKGAQNYLLQLDQLTRITGMSRKQAAAALKEQSMDKKMNAVFAAMDEGAKENVQGILAMIKSASPELEAGYKDIIAMGGAPITDMGKSIMVNNKELGLAALAVKENRMTTDEFQEVFKTAIAKAKERAKVEGDTWGVAASKGITLFDSQIAMMGIGKDAFKKMTEAEKEQAITMANAKKQVMNFQQQIMDVRQEVMKGLAPMFEELSLQLGNVVQWLKSDDGIAKFKEFSLKFKTGIAELIKDVKEMNFRELFEKWLAPGLFKAGISIPGWVKDMFFGKERTAEVKALEATQAKLTAAIAASKDGMVTMEVNGKMVKKTVEEAKLELEAIQKKLEEPGDKTSWWSSLMDAMIWLGPLGATLAVGGAVYAAIIGMKALLLGFSVVLAAFGVPPVILGAAVLTGIFIGTSVAIMAVGKGIKMAGEGIQLISDSLSAMSEIKDTDNLKSIAGVLGELAGPLKDLAVGGVIAGFIKEGALESLANSMNAFNNVDATKLQAVGPAISALYEGTSKFTGEGAWSGFSKWVGSLFGGGDNQFQELADGLKAFEGVDASNLASIGTGLEGIATFITQLNAAKDLQAQVTAIKSLIVELKKYQKTYSGMSDEMKNSINMSVGNSGKETVEALNQLNTVLQQLIYEQQVSNNIGKKIVGAVDNAGTL